MAKPNLQMIAQMERARLRTILEYDFAVAICRYAEDQGWKVSYTRKSGYRTADGTWRGVSPKGEPDLRFARLGSAPRFIECKAETGQVSQEQQAWLDALGEHGRLVRPRDAAEIMEILR